MSRWRGNWKGPWQSSFPMISLLQGWKGPLPFASSKQRDLEDPVVLQVFQHVSMPLPMHWKAGLPNEPGLTNPAFFGVGETGPLKALKHYEPPRKLTKTFWWVMCCYVEPKQFGALGWWFSFSFSKEGKISGSSRRSFVGGFNDGDFFGWRFWFLRVQNPVTL